MQRNLLQDVIALAGGVLFPLCLSPFDFWPVAFISPVLLFAVILDCSVRRAVLRFYLYNLGMFGVGASWIFVSIHEYGGASVLLAGVLVLLIVVSYSLVSIPHGYLFARFLRSRDLYLVPGFAGLWVLQEWFRSWILTGFPWLYVGYGVLDTPLASVAPVAGIYGVSLVVVAAGTACYQAWQTRSVKLLSGSLALVVLCVALQFVEFTQPAGSVSVSLVQGNIDQHSKWHPQNRVPILNLYRGASQDEWGREIIVWPEAALTLFREEAEGVLEELGASASNSGSTLVLGIPDRNEAGGFQNTVVAVGEGSGQYIKRRLVPFGEYVPLETLLRGLITLFDLPMSRNVTGPDTQDALLAGGLKLSVSICYEAVYPGLVRSAVSEPDLLVTVSNDTWFGSSIGPWQHLQMARMRALENGRPMLRSTNNGVTAVIDHRGRVQSELPQFKPGILRDDANLRSGITPFHRFGSYPVLMLVVMLAIASYLRRQAP